MNKVIKLSHGDGEKHTQMLIKEIFYKYFNNKLLLQDHDAAVISIMQEKMVFTTDSFVVKP